MTTICKNPNEPVKLEHKLTQRVASALADVLWFELSLSLARKVLILIDQKDFTLFTARLHYNTRFDDLEIRIECFEGSKNMILQSLTSLPQFSSLTKDRYVIGNLLEPHVVIQFN